MLQLDNKTPFAADIALFPNERGVDSLYVIVKASFMIGKEWVLADEQSSPVKVDEYWGEPGKASLKYASDFHIGKPATDIVMLGSAQAKDNQPVKQLDVSLRVGQLEKTVRVFGNRFWRGDGTVSDAEAFSAMPLVYERAFGGPLDNENKGVELDPVNPVGVGRIYTENEALPNIEDPRDLIQGCETRPFPAGFGFIAPFWLSRANLAGTYDERWKAFKAPYLPDDFDPSFLNSAHPDLICDGYLGGGERVVITNMHPSGNMSFELPTIKLAAKFNLGDKVFGSDFDMETLILEPNNMRVSFVWRASFEADKNVRKIQDIQVTMAR